jgi:hemerythrin HHE cation binding domain-containing protein
MTQRLVACGSDAPSGSGPISRFLAGDHARLDTWLRRAVAQPDAIDGEAYAEFRRGLLKHIGMEEKILLPAAQQARGGEPLPIAAKLRRDHGALAALLVPSPTQQIIAALTNILMAHNAIEEGPDGLYAICEQLVGADAPAVLAQLQSAPEVPVAAYNDSPRAFDAARRSLARAGYDAAASTL